MTRIDAHAVAQGRAVVLNAVVRRNTLTLQHLFFFFFEKSRETPKKNKGFSLRGTPKILGKGRKNAQKKQGKSENEKSKEIKKKQGLEGQGTQKSANERKRAQTQARKRPQKSAKGRKRALPRKYQRRKIHPKKSTQNKNVHLNEFF